MSSDVKQSHIEILNVASIILKKIILLTVNPMYRDVKKKRATVKGPEATSRMFLTGTTLSMLV